MTTLVPESLETVHALVAPGIRAGLDRLAPKVRLTCGYHFGFWDVQGKPGTSAGKGMRAAYTLLSALAAGQPAARAVPAAVAVELVHNYSLLHDDVMDQDKLRRHRPTAWTVYGESNAILAGDALFALAFELLAEAPEPSAPQALRSLGAAARRLTIGQSADLDFEGRDDVTLDECLSMSRNKTAALFACACSLGAVLCGAPADLTRRLTRFGEHLGTAFQLVDDLLGIWGSTEITGKPVLHDLQSRKKSVPVVYALNSGTPAGSRLRDLYLSLAELTGDELSLAADLVEQAGGRSYTEREAERQLELALCQLDGIAGLPGQVRSDLVNLTHYVTGRDR